MNLANAHTNGQRSGGAVKCTDVLDEIARTAHTRASVLGDGAALLLVGCSGAMPAAVEWTEYAGGKTDTYNGSRRLEPWLSLGEEMKQHAKRVGKKYPLQEDPSLLGIQA